jgi:regulator of replication initiation timing
VVQQQDLDINVDGNRVTEKLKAKFASQIAELNYQIAMLEVALEEAIQERNQAEEENTKLRKETGLGDTPSA